MTAFDTAWALLKTDVRLPSPIGRRPSFFDPHASLAFHGSMIPQSQGFENAVDGVPNRDYEVGDFAEEMKDGTIDRDWQNSFNPPHRLGAELLVNEINRASMIEALNESGIFDENEIDRIFEDMHDFEDRSEEQMEYLSRRMLNNKGWTMSKPLRGWGG
tara:strand:- start:57 stop:533 length:477 start_codon:yes stop_codon:yes gene_type:complete